MPEKFVAKNHYKVCGFELECAMAIRRASQPKDRIFQQTGTFAGAPDASLAVNMSKAFVSMGLGVKSGLAVVQPAIMLDHSTETFGSALHLGSLCVKLAPSKRTKSTDRP